MNQIKITGHQLDAMSPEQLNKIVFVSADRHGIKIRHVDEVVNIYREAYETDAVGVLKSLMIQKYPIIIEDAIGYVAIFFDGQEQRLIEWDWES